MGESYYSLRISDKAEKLAQMALEISRRRQGRGSAATATGLTLLGAVKMQQRDLVNAEKFTQEGLDIRVKLVESYSIIKKQFGQQHQRTREAGSPLIALYEIWGKQDRAAAIKAELGIMK